MGRPLRWLAVVLMTVPVMATAEEAIRLQRFDGELRLTGQATWDAGGEVRGSMIALPGGEFAAVVDEPKGRRVLVRWDERGKELQRVRVDVPGAVGALGAQKDGAYVVVTDREVAKVRSKDGVVEARRPLPDRSGETGNPELAPPFMEPSVEPELASVTEGGAWIGYEDQVVFVGLDGRTVTRKLPVPPPPEKQCKKEYGEVKGCPYRFRFGWLWGLGGGSCLLDEKLDFFHDAGGSRRTEQVALTLLDGEGRSGAQATLGEVKSRLEWFNFESSGGNFSIFPGKFTLVRRAYEGNAAVGLAGERPGGDFLIMLVDGGVWLVRLDRTLRVKWKRWVQGGGVPALAPSWSKGIFLFSGGVRIHGFDENGGSERLGSVKWDEYDPSNYRSVANQSSSGEWLLAFYGRKLENEFFFARWGR